MPHERYTFEPYPHRVRVAMGGVTIADSTAAMEMRETRLPPVIYIPREDVAMNRALNSGHVTHCPFKGNAIHYHVCAGEARADNILWAYEQPLAGSEELAGYVAFYAERVCEWTEDERAVPKEERAAFSGYENPLLGWALNWAGRMPDVNVLTEQFALAMAGAGIDVARLQIILQTLHPLVVGHGVRWNRGVQGVENQSASYAVLDEPSYLNSPIRLIFDGEGGVRQRLEGDNPQLDFGISKDLREEGMTDYAALPLRFSNGDVHAMTICTDRPGGFTEDELGNIHEVSGVLAATYEVHALRHKNKSLLETYLGDNAATRVLAGNVRRGAGEDISAVIMFADLRQSTALSTSMHRSEFLAMLNEFFDCIAGAVIDHGGEVLRFIGDAVLAVFPVDGSTADGDEPASAAVRAVAAAREARVRLGVLNGERSASDRPSLGCGIGLHMGDVSYGNIGTAARLEFTVVGEAANAAARIENLCKELDRPLLVSGAVARHLPGECEPMGERRLRGVGNEVAVYAVS